MFVLLISYPGGEVFIEVLRLSNLDFLTRLTVEKIFLVGTCMDWNSWHDSYAFVTTKSIGRFQQAGIKLGLDPLGTNVVPTC